MIGKDAHAWLEADVVVGAVGAHFLLIVLLLLNYYVLEQGLTDVSNKEKRTYIFNCLVADT